MKRKGSLLISFQDTLQDSLQPEEYRILAFRLDSQTVCGLEQLFNVLWVFCLFIYFLCVKKFVRLDLFFLILLKWPYILNVYYPTSGILNILGNQFSHSVVSDSL